MKSPDYLFKSVRATAQQNPISMAIYKTLKGKSRFQKPRSPTVIAIAAFISCIGILYLVRCFFSTNGFSLSTSRNRVWNRFQHNGPEKYLYWGSRIDCPGKHCESCAGLGHQESSLRCALEEAMFLNRTFVMPSRMCINPLHNQKGILHQTNNSDSDEDRWLATSSLMDSLYDLELISETVPVVMDNSKVWYRVLTTGMKLGSRGIVNVNNGVGRVTLKEDKSYSNILLINRTASPLSWFADCKDRKNHSSILLPYSFLPSMAAKQLRDIAEKIISVLGDYDAIHVRRGDILNTRKDRFGVERSLHPHLDRDTQPEFIMCRIRKWVPPGRTLFIASNERKPGFFSPLAARYRLAYSSNFSDILDPVIQNNYQLFMVERLVMRGSKTFINTYKETDTDLSLTDDPKKNTKIWQMPVYTKDTEEC